MTGPMPKIQQDCIKTGNMLSMRLASNKYHRYDKGVYTSQIDRLA